MGHGGTGGLYTVGGVGPPGGHLPVSGDLLFMVGCGRFTSEPGVLPDVAPRLPLVRVVTPCCLCEQS